MPVRLALYQPDIPQNAGTLMRLCACLGVALDIIEPCGFVLDDRRVRRSGMDYLEGLDLTRHTGWTSFDAARRQAGGRLVLLTARGAVPHLDFAFRPGDTLLLGRESAGVPEEVHEAADARVLIPLRPGFRSLNVAIAGSMALGEALRQLDGYPTPQDRSTP